MATNSDLSLNHMMPVVHSDHNVPHQPMKANQIPSMTPQDTDTCKLNSKDNMPCLAHQPQPNMYGDNISATMFTFL